MARERTYSPIASEAARLLGARVKLARRERGWTLRELADRVGVTQPTMIKIERGDPSVGLGVAFEAAALTGVALFDENRSRVRIESAQVEALLALLPQAVRKPAEPDDDF